MTLLQTGKQSVIFKMILFYFRFDENGSSLLSVVISGYTRYVND